MSMSEHVTVELRLIEQSFRLGTTTDKQPELERAGRLLNEKFQEFRRKAPNVEHNKLVIMVALELMQEVLGMNKSLQEYAQCERLLETMLEDVEKAG
jgi:cell division protein ZapA